MYFYNKHIILLTELTQKNNYSEIVVVVYKTILLCLKTRVQY